MVGMSAYEIERFYASLISKGSYADILLKNSKIAEPNIFAIGAKYRKPPLNLLAPTYKRFRVAIIEN